MASSHEMQKYQSAAIISKRVAELEEGSDPIVDAEKLGLYDTYSVAKYEFDNGHLKYTVTLKAPKS